MHIAGTSTRLINPHHFTRQMQMMPLISLRFLASAYPHSTSITHGVGVAGVITNTAALQILTRQNL
jgi:hypothetical protein